MAFFAHMSNTLTYQDVAIFSAGQPKILFFFLILSTYFILGCAGPLLLLRLFSSCGEEGLVSGCSVCVSLLAEHRPWGHGFQ